MRWVEAPESLVRFQGVPPFKEVTMFSQIQSTRQQSFFVREQEIISF